jgi:hypothetical protein
MWIQLVMQDVSKIALQWYSKRYCVANIAKTFTLKGVQTIVQHSPHSNIWNTIVKHFQNTLYINMLHLFLHSFILFLYSVLPAWPSCHACLCVAPCLSLWCFYSRCYHVFPWSTLSRSCGLVRWCVGKRREVLDLRKNLFGTSGLCWMQLGNHRLNSFCPEWMRDWVGWCGKLQQALHAVMCKTSCTWPM